jgi:uncharacterized protein (DUF1778 family)
MARPKKDPSLLMNTDLRIPVTAEQKMLVTRAAESDQSDTAAWVRSILIRAAQKKLHGLDEPAKNGRLPAGKASS